MNYRIFDKMEEGGYAQWAGETEQEYMERVLRAVVAPCPDKEKVSFNDAIEPEFSSCSAEDKSLCLRYRPQSWQQNPSGVLHGGIIASTIDMTLGVLSRYYVRHSKSVTVQLSINFMRELSLEHTFCVVAKAEKIGKRVRFLSAKIVDETTGNTAAEGTSVFM